LDYGDDPTKSSTKLDRRQNVLSRKLGGTVRCRLAECSCRRPATSETGHYHMRRQWL